VRVITVPCLSDNYAYLVIASDGRAVVVDPSEANPVASQVDAADADLRAIWLTHHHYDHVGGIEALCQKYGQLEVIASTHDLKGRRIPRQTRGVDQGDVLQFADRRAEVIATPGHTLGHVAYLIDTWLFTGDTLFIAGCGRVFEGSLETMHRTLDTLRNLEPTTRIYCGHEYTVGNLEFARTVEPDNPQIQVFLRQAQEKRKRGEPTVPGSLADELRVNPFLRWDVERVKAKAAQIGAADDSPPEVFGAIRRAKDRF